MKKLSVSTLGTFIATGLMLLSGCGSPKYHGTKDDIAKSYALERYGMRVAKEQNMQLLIVGNVTDCNEIDYCLTLRSFQKLNLNQGRILAANHMENFLKMLKSSPEVKEYLVLCHAELLYTPTEVLVDNIAYKIAFWDENINRPEKPYLAEILFADKAFHYFQADPQTQALQLVFQEPYESALEFRNKTKN